MGLFKDSPVKQLFRELIYNKYDVTRANEKYWWHVVIPSRECGDIKTLLRNGADPSNIMAIDIDHNAIVAAKKLLGADNYVYHDNILKAIKEWSENDPDYLCTATVNLDLCKTLPKSIPILQAIIPLFTKKTKIYFTFMAARDNMHSMEERLNYLKTKTEYWRGIKTWHPYQSRADTRPGSPMVFVEFE